MLPSTVSEFAEGSTRKLWEIGKLAAAVVVVDIYFYFLRPAIAQALYFGCLV
jgi:hypothetical protein